MTAPLLEERKAWGLIKPNPTAADCCRGRHKSTRLAQLKDRTQMGHETLFEAWAAEIKNLKSVGA